MVNSIGNLGGVIISNGNHSGENIPIQNYKEIHENDNLGKALALFENSTDVLVVFTPKQEYAGVLVERSILRSDLDPGKSKVKSFKTSAPKVQVNTELMECARLMLENNVLFLPVFHNDKIIGLTNYIEILRSPILEKFARRTVRDVMVRNLPVANPGDKIGAVYNKFKKSDIFSIPVVDNDKFLGMIYLHDTVRAILQHKEKPDFGTKLGEKKHLLDLPVTNIMAEQVNSLSDSATIGEVIELIIEKKLDCVSIIDEENFLQSVVTVKDLLRLITTQKEIILTPTIRINSKIDGLNRNRVKAAVNAFVKKYRSILSPGEFEIYMREHKEKQKHQKLIYTRIQVHAHKDKFEATAEAFGEDQSVKEAIDKLEKQIRRMKRFKKHGGR
ncbi:CBS domain-containing protein [[Eubacterium] cellulosolvens]